MTKNNIAVILGFSILWCLLLCNKFAGSIILYTIFMSIALICGIAFIVIVILITIEEIKNRK